MLMAHCTFCLDLDFVGAAAMRQTYTVVVKRESDCWIGWIEEVACVNRQEPTRDDLLESLRITLAEAIDDQG